MVYYVAENGQKVGPIEENQLLAHGVTVNTMVWHEGMADWMPAGQLPELGYMFGAQQPQQPAATVQVQYAQQQAKPYPPKNWLVESILVTLFCCLPFGIVGIIKASNVNTFYAAGNYEQAEQASQDAGKWTKIGFFVGIGWIVLYAIFMLCGVFAAMAPAMAL